MRPSWIMAILYTVLSCSPSTATSHSPPVARGNSPCPRLACPKKKERGQKRPCERMERKNRSDRMKESSTQGKARSHSSSSPISYPPPLPCPDPVLEDPSELPPSWFVGNPVLLGCITHPLTGLGSYDDSSLFLSPFVLLPTESAASSSAHSA